MSKNWLLNAILGAAVLAMTAASALAQGVVKEAMATFPMDTSRLEYSSTAKLRQLPDYATLHERYLGPSLRTLETQLATLGIRETDINEIVLGWSMIGGKLTMEGLAAGQIDPQIMARDAAAQGVPPHRSGPRRPIALEPRTARRASRRSAGRSAPSGRSML